MSDGDSPFVRKERCIPFIQQRSASIFRLLLRDLRLIDSELATILFDNLLIEIMKRRSILSTILAILHDDKYDFSLEAEIGSKKPGKQASLSVLESIAPIDVVDPEPEREATSEVREASM